MGKLEDIYSNLKVELKKSNERLQEYKKSGFYEQEAGEKAKNHEILKEISQIKKDNAELSKLESELKGNDKKELETQKKYEQTQIELAKIRCDELKKKGSDFVNTNEYKELEYEITKRKDSVNKIDEKIVKINKISSSVKAIKEKYKIVEEKEVSKENTEKNELEKQEKPKYKGESDKNGITDFSNDSDFEKHKEDLEKFREKLNENNKVKKKSIFKRLGESLKSVWIKIKNRLFKKEQKLLAEGSSVQAKKKNMKDKYKVSNVEELKQEVEIANELAKNAYENMKQSGYEFEGKTISDIQLDQRVGYNVACRIQATYNKEKEKEKREKTK